ncbi:MAG: AAA family ATPase, partial [Actinomycetota bacterium]
MVQTPTTSGGTDVLGALVDAVLDPASTDAVSLVVGAPGIGKTHLLGRLATEVEAAGALVGWCACGDAAGGAPLGELIEAGSLLDPPLHPHELGDDPLAVLRGVERWLDEVGSDGPTMLVLDDLHEAGPATLEVVRRLGRRPRRTSWTLVAATRPSLNLLSDHRGPQHRLGGLGLDDARVLARASGHADIDDDELHRLLHRTGGNPLFVRRLLERGGADAAVTPELGALLQDSLSELDDGVRPVVEALAVLGSAAPRTLLATMLGSQAQRVAELRTDDVIVVDGTSASFHHPLLRELVVEGLDHERRSELHRRAAEALDRHGADPAAVALHWRQAATTAPARAAADMALRAGHLAMGIGALTEAADHFAHAGVVLTDLRDRDQVVSSAVYRARALSLGGDVGSAWRLLSSLDDVGSAGDEARRAAARELLRLRWREEPNPTCLDGDRLAALVDSWLHGLDDPTDRCLAGLARVAAGEIDGPRAHDRDAAADAVAAAEASGDLSLRAEAQLAMRRALMVWPGSFDARRTASEAAVAAARSVDDRELLGRSVRMLHTDAMVAGDRAETLATLATFDVAATAALREHQGLAHAGLAAIEGRYDDADRILTVAAKDLADSDLPATSLEFVRVVLALDTGALAAELAQYEPLIAVIADPALTAAFALAAAVEGDADRCRRFLDDLVPELVADPTPVLWPVSMAMVAEAAAAVDHERCGDLLAALTPFAGSCITPAAASTPWLGSVDRHLGLLALRAGDEGAAVDHLTASLVTHEAMRARPWAARSHAALAMALRRVGRDDDAEAHAARADALVRELGMGSVALVGEWGVTASRRRVTPGRRATFVREGAGWSVGLDGGGEGRVAD